MQDSHESIQKWQKLLGLFTHLKPLLRKNNKLREGENLTPEEASVVSGVNEKLHIEKSLDLFAIINVRHPFTRVLSFYLDKVVSDKKDRR